MKAEGETNPHIRRLIRAREMGRRVLPSVTGSRMITDDKDIGCIGKGWNWLERNIILKYFTKDTATESVKKELYIYEQHMAFRELELQQEKAKQRLNRDTRSHTGYMVDI